MLLHSFSDDQIIARIHRLTRRERSATLLVLLHLNEIERRQLHLALGYSSMFAFCTAGLGYSESDAGRRIAAARCVARFPEIYGLLESNAVTVATISRVASILTDGNKGEILARIQGRTQDQVEAIVAEIRPRAAKPRDRVEVMACRSVPRTREAPFFTALSEPDPAPCNASEPVVSERTCEMNNDSHDESECKDLSRSRDNRPASAAPTNESPPPEKSVRLSFIASEEFHARVQRVRVLAAHRLPRRPSLEDVFEFLIDEFLAREDPARRREKRARVSEGRKGTRKAGAASVRARRIPAAVRDEIFLRDDGRCSFVGKDGRRCGSTHMLQVDHIQPVALGGAGTDNNLRLLCAYHNRFEAERVMGSQRCSARVAASGCPQARDY